MNAAELIEDALEHVGNRAPDVKKAALLPIARVQLKTDPARARATLESGLAVPVEPVEAARGFSHLGRLATACVAPQLLLTLPPPEVRGAFDHDSFQIPNLMVKHGHIEYLRTYMLKDAPLSDVPMNGFPLLIQAAQDDEERRLFLRRAAKVWQLRDGRAGVHVQFSQFSRLLSRHWRLLPREEAQATLTEIIDQLLAWPNQEVSGRVGAVSFSSSHASEIFHLFDLLLELDPERAKQLAAAYSDLAIALKRYPKGQRTMIEEAEAARAKLPKPGPQTRGYGFAGSSRDFEYAKSLIEAQESKDFSEPLKHAAASYRQDSDPINPNRAAKEFWPSSAKYKSIFHSMASELGEAAAPELATIKDIDLRLLAQIEFAAGLSGFPELSAMTVRQRERPWR